MNYNEIYRFVFEHNDEKRIEKLIEANERGQLKTCNYWETVRRWCANVKSDHALSRWQIIAENFYRLYIEEAAR